MCIGWIDYNIKMNGNNYLIEFKRSDIDFEFKENQETKKAIVRGAFLGSGSLTEQIGRAHV